MADIGKAERTKCDLNLTALKHEERKPTRCNNIDGLLSIMGVDY